MKLLSGLSRAPYPQVSCIGLDRAAGLKLRVMDIPWWMGGCRSQERGVGLRHCWIEHGYALADVARARTGAARFETLLHAFIRWGM